MSSPQHQNVAKNSVDIQPALLCNVNPFTRGIRDEIKVLKFCLKEPTTTSENIKEENELTKLTNLLTSNLNTWIEENELAKLTTSLNAWMNRGSKEQATARLADIIIILRTIIIMIIIITSVNLQTGLHRRG